MKPRLFPATARTFNNGGIGSLSDVVSCDVTEELNGIFDLEMQYPINGAHYSEIVEERIIYAQANSGDNGQPFRISRITRPMNGLVTVYANHVSYLLDDIVFSNSGTLGRERMLSELNILGWSFPREVARQFTLHIVNDMQSKSMANNEPVEAPKSTRAYLLDNDDSVISWFGPVEYKFDKWDIYIYKNRGVDSGVVLSYGKNITGIEKDSNISSVVTAVVPYFRNRYGAYATLPYANGMTGYIDGDPVVYNEHYTNYLNPLAKAIDFTDVYNSLYPDGAEVEDYNVLYRAIRAAAKAYMTDNSTWNLPATINVSFVPLWQTDQYKNVMALQELNIGDRVTVRYEKLGIDAKLELTKTVYNTLTGRYKEVELGTRHTTIVNVMQELIDRRIK